MICRITYMHATGHLGGYVGYKIGRCQEIREINCVTATTNKMIMFAKTTSGYHRFLVYAT